MKTASLKHLLEQGCTSPGRQLSVASKFCMLALKICGRICFTSSFWQQKFWGCF